MKIANPPIANYECFLCLAHTVTYRMRKENKKGLIIYNNLNKEFIIRTLQVN